MLNATLLVELNIAKIERSSRMKRYSKSGITCNALRHFCRECGYGN